MEPGIYPDLSIEDYHADSTPGKSVLSTFLKHPSSYRTFQTAEQTPEMNFGNVSHWYHLQRHLFDRTVVVIPPEIKKKQGAKWEKFKADNEGMEYITDTQHGMLTDMGVSLSLPHHSCANTILNHVEAIVEESIFFQHPVSDIVLKVRPDIRIPSARTLVDYKTCKSATYEGFQTACANYDYHLQAALYLMGVSEITGHNYENFLFVCQEKTYPYRVAVYRADDEFVSKGQEKLENAVAMWVDKTEDVKMESYPNEIIDISLPGWA